MSYQLELQLQAHDLYVDEQLSFDAIAARLGIAQSTLKEWAAEYHWVKDRKNFKRAVFSLNSNLMIGLATTAKEFAAHPDSKNADILGKVMKVAPAGSRRVSAALDRAAFGNALVTGYVEFAQSKRPELAGDISRLMADYLEENPEIFQMRSAQLKKLRDKVRQTAEKIGALTKSKGLDAETLRVIREQIYGIIDASNSAL